MATAGAKNHFDPPCLACPWRKAAERGALTQSQTAAVVVAKLPERERQVLAGLASSKTIKQVAGELGISPKTAEFHRANLYKRTELLDISGLTRLAIRAGLVSLAILAGCVQSPTPGPALRSAAPATALLQEMPPESPDLVARQDAAPATARRSQPASPEPPPAAPARYLAWQNPPGWQVFSNGWRVTVESTTNLTTWQTFTNLPMAVTNCGPIPAGRCWRVGYRPWP